MIPYNLCQIVSDSTNFVWQTVHHIMPASASHFIVSLIATGLTMLLGTLVALPIVNKWLKKTLPVLIQFAAYLLALMGEAEVKFPDDGNKKLANANKLSYVTAAVEKACADPNNPFVTLKTDSWLKKIPITKMIDILLPVAKFVYPMFKKK